MIHSCSGTEKLQLNALKLKNFKVCIKHFLLMFTCGFTHMQETINSWQPLCLGQLRGVVFSKIFSSHLVTLRKKMVAQPKRVQQTCALVSFEIVTSKTRTRPATSHSQFPSSKWFWWVKMAATRGGHSAISLPSACNWTGPSWQLPAIYLASHLLQIQRILHEPLVRASWIWNKTLEICSTSSCCRMAI